MLLQNFKEKDERLRKEKENPLWLIMGCIVEEKAEGVDLYISVV